MENKYFKIEKLTKRITKIRGISEELMYLVEGDEKSALIDTGVGLGNLKEFVEQMTQKPIIVLLTHGHVDHALGAGLFDTVYMSPLDEKVYLENIQKPHRERFYDLAIDNWREFVTPENYIEKSVDKFEPLMDGQRFELGGITIEARLLSGHTPGSMVFLFEEERSVLFGDACNTSTYVYDHNSCYISEYRENLIALKTHIDGRYDSAYLSHGPGDVPVGLLDSAIELTQDIMEGNTDDLPFELLGINAFFAKDKNEKFERLDGGIANIVYSKHKVIKE